LRISPRDTVARALTKLMLSFAIQCATSSPDDAGDRGRRDGDADRIAARALPSDAIADAGGRLASEQLAQESCFPARAAF
jgi:hypothetical protein